VCVPLGLLAAKYSYVSFGLLKEWRVLDSWFLNLFVRFPALRASVKGLFIL
jgi:hypothetical protein